MTFTDDLVERVAAKMHSSESMMMEPWENLHPDDQEGYLCQARAALEYLESIHLLRGFS